MATIELWGRVNDSGELEIDQPEGLRPGPVKVIIVEQDSSWEETPWTAEEIRELMKPEPKTGAEIAAMIESGEIDTSEWAARDIPDSVEWVNEIRRQERQQRGLE